jgi:hypothetical protein
MTSQDFARTFARIRTPLPSRERWLQFWADHLAACPPWRYRHPGGGHATFRPSPLTFAVLAELSARADEEGFAEVAFAELAHALDVEDPADLGAHVRALRHLGVVERYARPGACNRYRLALERLPHALTPQAV